MPRKFDLISDPHIDLWIEQYGMRGFDDPQVVEDRIRRVVMAIVPDEGERSKVLVVAGDLGHFNWQNAILLRVLRDFYESVVVVPGNHDYYLVDVGEELRYDGDSMTRVAEMRAVAGEIPGVHWLDGDVVELDGIAFGGTGMWYDFEFGMQEFGLSERKMEEIRQGYMNDPKAIFGMPSTLDFFRSENRKLRQVVDKSDVIVTHVGPDWSHVHGEHRMTPTTGFFFFDGSEYADRVAGKVWCFGHTHARYDYDWHGARMVNNALGTPYEYDRSRRIVTIEMD